MGPAVDLPDRECKRIVNLYRKSNKKITELWSYMDGVLKHMAIGKPGTMEVNGHTVLQWEDNSVWLPNGMGLHYPKLRSTESGYDYVANGKRKKIYGGLLTENVVQALARIIVGEQMLKVAEKADVVLMTHDEIVCVEETRKAPALLKYMLQEMRRAPEWCQGIPLDAEGGYDTRYSK